ncbi:hypothetical protein GO755_13010 [Spirosoma sp. HMF4905]|uniref:Outer membrane protein beta-barrel domain-containing protein n=1 Tax=Spirosoma arboris TaxID=2682092 RepID=A0A7K1SB20_9BACT|nr:hypothetical protein [Spirosoma arboris]MVM30955.1 hypothetical protein [Spirosoma arboris]
MSKYIVTILVVYGVLVLDKPVLGQQRTQILGLTAGFSPLQIKDQFRSDYTYRGVGLGLQAYYGQNRSTKQWLLEAAYSRATPQSIVSRKASTQLVDLTFNYLWRLSSISRPGNRLQYFGGLGVHLFSTTTNYSPDIDVSTIVTTGIAALGLSAKASYQLSARQHIQGQGFVSVLSGVYRPNYAYFGRDQLAISWFGQNPILGIQVSYQYQLSKKIAAVSSYQLTYFQYDKPRPVNGLYQSVRLGLQRTF